MRKRDRCARSRVERCPIERLDALVGLPLVELSLLGTAVRDLGPLSGMPLERLELPAGFRMHACLAKLPLRTLVLTPPADPKDIAALREMDSLTTINHRPAADFWKDLDAGLLAPVEPLDPAWVDVVRQLPPSESLRRIRTELARRHQGVVAPKGLLTPSPLEAVVVQDETLRDLQPLRGLPKLERLMLTGARHRAPDLRTLRDLPLLSLEVSGFGEPIPLSQLAGMPLRRLEIRGLVRDLDRLTLLPLVELRIDPEPADLRSIVRRMPTLKSFNGRKLSPPITR